MPPSKAKGGKIGSPSKSSASSSFKLPKHKEISKESSRNQDEKLRLVIGQQLDIKALYNRPKPDQPSKKTMISLAKPK